MFDLIIIGGGPAGAAAGVYAARKRLTTLFITDSFGGQSVVSGDIQNWIGTPSITGADLARGLREHVQRYAGDALTIREGERATRMEHKGAIFSITTNKGVYETKTVLIATGADRRRLEIPGAAEFENKGVTYCASCDGPLFTDMDVVVIGGGNAGFETAAQLLAYTKHVTLLHHSDAFKADAITVEKVLSHPAMAALTNAEPVRILGDRFVTGVVYKDKKSEEEKKIAVSGVFVEIGIVPATHFAEELLTLDEFKRIVIDPWTQRASAPGVWAAGDCSNIRYHQNNIAAGDAVRAIEDIYLFLRAAR